MESLMKFEDLLLRELDELTSKGDLSPSEMERGKHAVCTIKEIEETLAMSKYNEDPDNSFDNYSERNRNSYARMRSPRTGRYVSNDNSYNRSSYNRMTSNHSDEDMIMDLEMKMNHATNERDRQTISDMISILRDKR